jgi:hypothetical protein
VISICRFCGVTFAARIRVRILSSSASSAVSAAAAAAAFFCSAARFESALAVAAFGGQAGRQAG